MLTHTPFGSLLREFRLAAGLSQEALAERAGMSVDGISALERGTNKAPRRDTLDLLVQALRLSDEQRAAIEAAAIRPSRPRKPAERASKKHNLPSVATRLYGREREIGDVAALIKAGSLVSLTGAGGVGKTRLAIGMGDLLAADFADGVWFVDLADVTDPELVTNVAAIALGVSTSADRPPVETLVNTLRRKHILVVVDNCEHVIEAAGSLIQSLIDECPHVRILATSRQSLNLTAEQIYRVASLETEPAVALFEEHAKRGSRSFAVSEDNRGTIARIVRRLDGMALAIELAASRLNMLSLEQLEHRLSERFRLLSGGGQTKLPRHQTMRGTIDWSYDLLEDDERKLFCRLALFAAGFTLEAAGAVCSDDITDDWHVLELLASLVDKSLVVSEPAGTVHRYHLLETIREYARGKADDALERSLVGRRHAEYYTSLAEREHPNGALEPELENFRRALDWTLTAGNDPLLGVRLLTNLQEFLIDQGLAADGLRYAQIATASMEDAPHQLRAAFWLTIARLRHEFHMDLQALFEAASRACELYEASGESRELAVALRERSIAKMHMGALVESERDVLRSLDIARSSSDLRMVARSLGSLGCLRQIQGEYAQALPIMLECLQLSTEIGDDRSVAVMSLNIAETEFALGEVETAVGHARETLAKDPVIRKVADLRANQQSNLAAYLFALGRDDEARAAALLAIRDADPDYAAVPMQHMAAIFAPHDPKRAARLLGYIERTLSATGYTREYTEQYTFDRLMATLQMLIGPDEIARLERDGAAMSDEQALKLARHRLAQGHLDYVSGSAEAQSRV